MPLHVSDPFVAHHQKAASVYVANGICFDFKLPVGGPGWPTDELEIKQIPFATYTPAAS
jgi:hypothetical protein